MKEQPIQFPYFIHHTDYIESFDHIVNESERRENEERTIIEHQNWVIEFLQALKFEVRTKGQTIYGSSNDLKGKINFAYSLKYKEGKPVNKLRIVMEKQNKYYAAMYLQLLYEKYEKEYYKQLTTN